jgi:tRNA(Arg) A34 adenosine deaminase TadA
MEPDLTSQDATLLRASFEVALRAASAGNHPFGAILADREGHLLLEAENTVVTDGDITAHAETNLVRLIESGTSESVLASSTLFASTEPCAMCSGAIYWAGIGRLVFGLSQERFYSILGGERQEQALALQCREVLARGGRHVEVVGPALEDEAARVHGGFWS